MVRLRLHPELCHSRREDGKALFFLLEAPYPSIVAEPDLERLLGMFGAVPRAVEQVAAELLRAERAEGREPKANRIQEAVAQLQELGLLVPGDHQRSEYDGTMAPFYRQHRAVPTEIADAIAADAGLSVTSRVLDVATGAGSIALALSRHSHQVRGIDISEPLLDEARAAAQRARSTAQFENLSANRLIFSTEEYDVVTVGQAFHWFDAGLAVHGLHRVLAPSGALYMIESKYETHPQNPLRRLFQFGAPLEQPFPEHCLAHARRYELLFEQIRRVPPILRFTDLKLFRQPRRFDFDFARAFLLAPQVRWAFPEVPDPWAALRSAFESAAPAELEGTLYWFVARYQLPGRDGSWRSPSTPPPWIPID